MEERRYPPEPPCRSWVRGHLKEFRTDRLGFMTRWARDYGGIVGLRFGYRRVYLVTDPEAIEEVLIGQGRNFIKHYALRVNPLVFGKGLLTNEGDSWLRQRRLLQPAFLRTRIATYAPAMVEATERLLSKWQPGEVRDIYPEMMSLTLAIAAKTLFDADVEGDAAEVGQALVMLQENFLSRVGSLVPPPLWLPLPQNFRLKRAVRRLDAIIFRFIQQRRQTQDKKTDLLSLLLQARDEEDGSGMTDQQVRDEAMTLFLAGYETTALGLSWTWFLLARHPEIEARLVAHVHEVLGNRLPTVEDISRLSYIEKIVLESMRLYPPVYTIGREATRDVAIGGYHVPRGTSLLMPQWVVHRDPRFFDQPEKFLPERWTEEFSQKLPRFAYYPFGGGPRICIGNTFSMMEMVLALAVMAPRFRFTMQSQEVVPRASFTLRPIGGILAPVQKRE